MNRNSKNCRSYRRVSGECPLESLDGIAVKGRNLLSVRTFAFATSSRFLAGDLVSREWSKCSETTAISSTAFWNCTSFVFDGLLKPVIFRTNCREAARISSAVGGGSKLKRGLMFLHIKQNRLPPSRWPLKEVRLSRSSQSNGSVEL